MTPAEHRPLPDDGPLRPPVPSYLRAVQWPLRSYAELPVHPAAVAAARHHTRQAAWEWGLTDLTDAAELVVSELITNAIRVSARTDLPASGAQAGPGAPAVRQWLSSDKRQLLIHVWDASNMHPLARIAGADAENGRGLFLVESMSRAWGVIPATMMPGKFVWACLDPDPTAI